MTDDRSLKAYDVYAEESRRFDYYITGAAAVALGFALQSLRPTGTSIDFLLPVAWGLLLVSLFGGLMHLNQRVITMSIGASQHEAGHRLSKVRDAYRVGGLARTGFGVEIAGEDLRVAADKLQTTIAQNTQSLERTNRVAEIAYWVRNLGLLAGVAAIALWRGLSLLLP